MKMCFAIKRSLLVGILAATLLCGCKTGQVIGLTPLENHVRHPKSVFRDFLDISIIYKSLVIRDSSDKNACQLAFDFNISWTTQLAHWIIYEPDRIIVMIEMYPSQSTLLPLEENDRAIFIKIPNRHGRPVFLADEIHERLVQETDLYTERTLPKVLFGRHISPGPDPFE